jgi:hypothetical protein
MLKIKSNLFNFFSCFQIPQVKASKLNSVEIYNQIQKLNFLGSPLYIAAHPDDENTRLISRSNEKSKNRLFINTRGDGGKPIGPEIAAN